MVRLDLEGEGEAEKDGPEYGIGKPLLPGGVLLGESLAVSEDDGGENPREIGQGQHLGVVPALDDLHVVGAEGNGDGSSHRQQGTDSQRKHQQEGAQQGDEQIAGRPASGMADRFEQGFDPVSGVVSGQEDGRHASEHGPGPCRLVLRVVFVPLFGFVAGPDVTGDVRGLDDFSLEDGLWHESAGKRREKEDCGGVQKDFFINRVHLQRFIDGETKIKECMESNNYLRRITWKRRLAKSFSPSSRRESRAP